MADNAERDVVTNPPTDAERPDLYLILIVGLLVIVGIGMISGALLQWFGKGQPDNLWAVTLVAIGALAGMLAVRKVA